MPLINLKTNLKSLEFGHDQRDGNSSKEPYIKTIIPSSSDPLPTGFLNFDIDTSNFGNPKVQIAAKNKEDAIRFITIGAVGGFVGGAFLGPGALAGLVIGAGVGTYYAFKKGGALKIEGDFSKIDPTNLKLLNTSYMFPSAGTGGPDWLIRGNMLLPTAVINDVIRFTDYFKDTKGILFTIKQNILSRTAVRPESTGGILSLLNEGVYLPYSSILGTVGTPIGLHVNKQGLNPLRMATNGGNYTPGYYYSNKLNENKEIQDDIKINTIASSNKNTEPSALLDRLYSLFYVKIQGKDTNSLTRRNDVANNSNFILEYGGGPNSFLGIGKTAIRYATDQFGFDLKVSNASNTLDESGNVQIGFGYGNTLTYEELSQFEAYGILTANKVIDFRSKLRNRTNNTSAQIPFAPSYDFTKNKTLERRTHLGDPGNSLGKDIRNYTQGYNDEAFGAASPFSYDKINALPVYRQTATHSPKDHPDLINFRIGVIDSNDPSEVDYIHFRAFLDTITDEYSSEWDSIKYIGRGDKFYNYTGFDRKMSFGWTVAAQSKIELIPMYKKLNYLASLTAPDYGSSGYLKGNIIKLTIGSYVVEQPGIITGLTYQMNSETDTWEIGIDTNGDKDPLVRQLPHIIRVTGFNFIPIHEFTPRKQNNQYNISKANNSSNDGSTTGYGPEQFISLFPGTLQDGGPYYPTNAQTIQASNINPGKFASQDDTLNQFTDGRGYFNPNTVDPAFLNELRQTDPNSLLLPENNTNTNF